MISLWTLMPNSVKSFLKIVQTNLMDLCLLKPKEDLSWIHSICLTVVKCSDWKSNYWGIMISFSFLCSSSIFRISLSRIFPKHLTYAWQMWDWPITFSLLTLHRISRKLCQLFNSTGSEIFVRNLTESDRRFFRTLFEVASRPGAFRFLSSFSKVASMFSLCWALIGTRYLCKELEIAPVTDVVSLLSHS